MMLFSSFGRPINWSPVGREMSENPLGTDIAGRPSKLLKAPISSCLTSAEITASKYSSIGGATEGRLGLIMQLKLDIILSNSSAIFPLNLKALI